MHISSWLRNDAQGSGFDVTVEEAILAIDKAEKETTEFEQDNGRDESMIKDKLRRIAVRYQQSEKTTEELVIRRAIEEIFEPSLDEPPARKGGRR